MLYKIYNQGSSVAVERLIGDTTEDKVVYPFISYDYNLTEELYTFKDAYGIVIISQEPVTAFLDSNDNPYSSRDQFELDLSNTIESGKDALVVFSREEASLLDGEEIDTGFIDFGGFAKQQITIISDTEGLTFNQSIKLSEGGVESVIVAPLSLPNSTFNVPIRETFQRLRLQNNSGGTITNVKFSIKVIQGSDGLTVSPLSSALVPQSQAGLVRAVISGQSIGSVSAGDQFRNVFVNQARALLTADFGTEVARGLIDNYTSLIKDGRNVDISIGTVPEDCWNGGGLYTGFDCVNAEILSVFSDNVNDSGLLVDSGVSTGALDKTMVDNGADFIVDGVTVGMQLINDTQKVHGIINAVTATSITVYALTNGSSEEEYVFNPGDSYRIASATGTGAAVVKLVNPLLDGFVSDGGEYIILNGQTSVLTTREYLRQSEAKVTLAGSSGVNQGEIISRQSVTIANVMMVMPANSNETAICCDTVPAGETWVLKSLKAQMSRSGGNNGSMNVRFQSRRLGEVFQTKVFPTITNAQDFDKRYEGGEVFTQFTDLKWNCQFASDNSSILTGNFEVYRIKNT